MSPRGFTLVELVLMISIIGILAYLAVPRVAGISDARLDAASVRIATDLRYARGRAASDRERFGVAFDPARDRYAVYASRPGTPVTDPADRSRPLGVDFRAPSELHGVEIESAAFGRGSTVAFDSWGVPRDAQGRELSAPGLVVLSLGGRSDTVEVAPSTGAVRVR